MTLKYPADTWSAIQKYLISVDRDHCRLTVLFAIPVAVELSQCISVIGCFCPSSSSMRGNIFASLAFMKRAPSPA